MAIHTAYSVRVNNAYPATTRRSPLLPATARNTPRRRLAEVDALIPVVLRARCPEKRPDSACALAVVPSAAGGSAPDQQMPSSRGCGPGPGGLEGVGPVEQRPAAQPLADVGGLADRRRGGLVLVRA